MVLPLRIMKHCGYAQPLAGKRALQHPTLHRNPYAVPYPPAVILTL
jgi:hypothetical protein